VADAGTTMRDIVNSVQRVAQLISEIGTAAEQQSLGINQVSHAVTQLDQVTQQNSALVEESAAAADSLRVQAQRLTEVVGAFRLRSAVAA
jgi:methyl-accepting chemotaxis protein